MRFSPFIPQDREAHCETQYKSVKADAEKIHTLVQENLGYFQAEAESEFWRNYVDYLDDVVLDGLFECVQCSLLYLKENTDKEREMPPLMMAKLELQVGIYDIWGGGIFCKLRGMSQNGKDLSK